MSTLNLKYKNKPTFELRKYVMNHNLKLFLLCFCVFFITSLCKYVYIINSLLHEMYSFCCRNEMIY